MTMMTMVISKTTNDILADFPGLPIANDNINGGDRKNPRTYLLLSGVPPKRLCFFFADIVKYLSPVSYFLIKYSTTYHVTYS